MLNGISSKGLSPDSWLGIILYGFLSTEFTPVFYAGGGFDSLRNIHRNFTFNFFAGILMYDLSLNSTIFHKVYIFYLKKLDIIRLKLYNAMCIKVEKD